MASQERPNGFGLIDLSGSNQPGAYPRELTESTNGYADLQLLPAEKYNHTQKRHGEWIRRFDQQTPPHPLFFGVTSNRVSLNGLEFDTGPGLSGSSQEDCAYVVKGHVVDLSIAELTNQGVNVWSFAATKDTHVYARTDGTLRFDPVTIATPPSENADDLWLGTMTTDATDRTVWTFSDEDAANRTVIVSAVPWEWTTPITARRAINFMAPNGQIRRHTRQNASANAKGYAISDTLTFEGVSGSQFLEILPAAYFPNGAAITVSARMAATNVAAINDTAHVVWNNFFTLIAGEFASPISISPDKEHQGTLLTLNEFFGGPGDEMGVSVEIVGAKVANIEISFDITVALP